MAVQIFMIDSVSDSFCLKKTGVFAMNMIIDFFTASIFVILICARDSCEISTVLTERIDISILRLSEFLFFVI